MRVFRRRRRFGNFRGSPEDGEPLPDIVYQMGAEQAARYATLASRPQSPYSAANLETQAPGYGFSEESYNEGYESGTGSRIRSSSPFRFIISALGIDRTRSHRQSSRGSMNSFRRSGSPAHVAYSPPGSPIGFQQRSFSPQLVQSRPSSPFQFNSASRVSSPLHFVPPERVSSPVHLVQQPPQTSPDYARRLQRAMLSQELQNIENQQKFQQSLMNPSPPVFPPFPQVQQTYYPAINPYAYNQGYSMMQQPQMYSYY